MRTTLDIDDDVLHAAKEIARREKRTLGETISALARRAFTDVATEGRRPATRTSEQLAVYGIHPLPPRGGIVSSELIERLSDEEGI